MRSAVISVTTVITVAAGAFAPGHLGELTRIVPFELADAVLEEEGGLERRVRLLPSRVGLYFLLAMCLFPQPGYLAVWGKLTAGLRVLARSSSAKVSAVTSGSRTGSHPGTVVLLGQHGIQLGAQGGLNRSAGGDALDGALQQAAVVAQLVAGQGRERVLGRGDPDGFGGHRGGVLTRNGAIRARCPSWPGGRSVVPAARAAVAVMPPGVTGPGRL